MGGRHQARYLDAGGRLSAAPSARLVRAAFARELSWAEALWEGLSYADLAHTVMLIETGIAPAAEGRRLLQALVEIHERGLEGMPIDPRWGDLYNNRDSELQRRLGRTAGWLHAGRARREALTIGWLLHLRQAGADLLDAIAEAASALTAVAGQHTETLMPDYTYLQHAQPTTLGHYLLGFAGPLVRDGERWERELDRLNESPAGAASTNGSRLPLNRERVRELLGFERLTVHARDAMWRPDVAVHTMAVLTSLATTADRLAEDLQIWCTQEFGFAELADEHCRTSVIMPNKKNPYVLGFVRGQARELDGRLMSVLATNQTPTGQIENRNTAYDLVPRSVADVRAMLELMAETVTRARYAPDRMAAMASAGFTFGTELADILLQRERIDARTAHEVSGRSIAAMLRTGTGLCEALPAAFAELVGRPLRLDPTVLEKELTPDAIVAARRGPGSCAPPAVREMIASIEDAAAALRRGAERLRTSGGFPGKLQAAVSRHLGKEWSPCPPTR